jgi:hypothetical protein
MTLPLPRNARVIVDARARRERPALPVIVSYVGGLATPCPVVYADSGRRYDWRFLAGLATAIAVRPGVDAADTIHALFEQMTADGAVTMAYPLVFDIERRHCFSVVRVLPRIGGMAYRWDSELGPPATLHLQGLA